MGHVMPNQNIAQAFQELMAQELARQQQEGQQPQPPPQPMSGGVWSDMNNRMAARLNGGRAPVAPVQQSPLPPAQVPLSASQQPGMPVTAFNQQQQPPQQDDNGTVAAIIRRLMMQGRQ